MSEVFIILYGMLVAIFTAALLLWCADRDRLPPRWILALWVFFVAPVVIKAWLAVVLS